MKNPDKPEAHSFDPSILRAYDIRGIVGKTLHPEDAFYIGKAFAASMQDGGKKTVCVGYDGRLSSPQLEEQLVLGLQLSGLAVIQVGKGPTPMLYHAVKRFKADGGIMITGSHNPPDYNGFKLMYHKLPLYGEGIQALGKIAASGEFLNKTGAVSQAFNIKRDYIHYLLESYKPGKRPLKIAWDAGNGAAGGVMTALTQKLQGEHILLNEVVDGTFPAHHPDPSVKKNMQQLIDTVIENKCDLGIAFDGDGDRIGVVDNQGNMLFGDQLMTLFAEEELTNHPGATIIADVKASQVLYDHIRALGGTPLMWKTGHSFIKTKMQEVGAVLAGEMSGHIFFADNYGFDDALYAAIRLLNIVGEMDAPLSEKMASLPVTYSTPEMRVHVDDTHKFAIVDAVKKAAKAAGAEVNDVDGLRCQTQDGWYLLRASNTEAALVARCEASSEDGLQRLQATLGRLLQQQGVELEPFSL